MGEGWGSWWGVSGGVFYGGDGKFKKKEWLLIREVGGWSIGIVDGII